MHLLCNVYWLDTSALQGCDLSKIKGPTYGFNQNADVAATLPPSPLDNFCASAKHNDSPNTFSIDSAALISSGSDCSGDGRSAQTASAPVSFSTYTAAYATEQCKEANEIAGREDAKGGFAVVDPEGNVIDLSYRGVIPEHRFRRSFPWGRAIREFNCDDAASVCVNCGGRMEIRLDGPDQFGVSHKLVFVGTMGTGKSDWDGTANGRKRENMKYNFETGMWVNRWGERYKGGKLVR